MTTTTPQAQAEALARIINQGLRPHAPELATIGFSGDVAVVVFEPGEDAKQTARAVGWDGEGAVFRLSAEGRRTLEGSTAAADPRFAKWLRRKLEPAAPVARILVLTGDETLLVNYGAQQGWFLEPEAAKAAPIN